MFLHFLLCEQLFELGNRMKIRKWLIVCISVFVAFVTIFYHSPVSAKEQPVAFEEEIYDFVDRNGVAELEKVYYKLQVQKNTHEDYYVRSQLISLLSWIEDEYALSTLILQDNSKVIKGDNKVLLMADWTVFSQEKSSIKFVKKENRTIENRTTEKDYDKRDSLIQKESSAISSIATSKHTKTTKPWSTPNIYTLSNWSIDITKVQEARQWRVNDLRSSRGLYDTSFEPILHKTAADWAVTIRNKKEADHRRFSNSTYYDYGQLVERFADRGVVFKNVSRATFTENVWRAYFSCDSWDCTQEAINSVQRIYKYFRDEEWKAYDAHRRTMIHPLFRVMGIWISVDEPNDRIYIVIHYWTEVIQ